MARPLRVEYAGAFYHVINRGNAGAAIFKSTNDRERFLDRIGRAVERFSLKIHTYCLMMNHYHLLVETPETNLSKAIQWLNVSYAAYFNLKHNRRGHLFQGRFKSILIDEDVYLKQLSRYIHLNPLRAKLVKDPSDYLWSSYREFVGKARAHSWLETKWLLRQFGRKKRDAIKNYRDFVEKIDFNTLGNPEKELTGGYILGSADFVQWIKETYLSSRSDEKEIPQLKKLKPTIDIEKIVDVVGDEFNCGRDMILAKGRKRNSARDVAIFLARDLTGESGVRLGEFFGKISGAAITGRCTYVSRELDRNKRLEKKINKLKRRIINN